MQEGGIGLRTSAKHGEGFSRPQSPRFVWSAVETRGSGNSAFRMS